jgi:hypothetical protein
MDLISLIVILALVGLGLWAVNKYIPMQETIKKILNVVVIGATILWLLYVFGVDFGNVQIPHTR